MRKNRKDAPQIAARATRRRRSAGFIARGECRSGIVARFYTLSARVHSRFLLALAQAVLRLRNPKIPADFTGAAACGAGSSARSLCARR